MVNIKIILSNKFKEHMKAHQNDFLIPFNDLINLASQAGRLDLLKKDFEEIIVKYPFNVGYKKLVGLDKDDDVVYAKRHNREIYTKFVKNKEAIQTNSIVMILKKNRRRVNEYYMITMFPGEIIIKEPQDENIKTNLELRKTLKFWEENALIYESNQIDTKTEVTDCPYNELYNQCSITKSY